jgi:hypothetical protein
MEFKGNELMKIDECLYEDLNREYDRNLEIIAGLEV